MNEFRMTDDLMSEFADDDNLREPVSTSEYEKHVIKGLESISEKIDRELCVNVEDNTLALRAYQIYATLALVKEIQELKEILSILVA